MIHSVKPNGVEHQASGNATLLTVAVIHSVTPNGVEHTPLPTGCHGRPAVIHSVTPNGVEHRHSANPTAHNPGDSFGNA